MRVLVQRVAWAKVVVGGEVVGAIGPGLLAFVGCAAGDTEASAVQLADKVVGLRVFEDEAGKMNRALADIGGGLLVVSQFTLYGDCQRGRRPSFGQAMAPEPAEQLIARFIAHARTLTPEVATGRFRAHMEVSLLNDGPVTLLLEHPAAAS
jgi:D-tyrosyl-tRNA(Tyr) deacylase